MQPSPVGAQQRLVDLIYNSGGTVLGTWAVCSPLVNTEMTAVMVMLVAVSYITKYLTLRFMLCKQALPRFHFLPL